MKPLAYYNEIDPAAAAWLRELIARGLIAQGEVDERSIEDVTPADLAGFRQCHFFAGIGGWSLALRLAGWPDDRPIWTGSCPCQPFSAAGKGAGFADERHLWPAFYWLIAQCRPAIVVGEQVASSSVNPWLDLVLADLEALGSTVGAVAFPASGIGAPHIRDRALWVGYTDVEGLEGFGGGHQAEGGRLATPGPAATAGEPVRLANYNRDGLEAIPVDRLHHSEHHAKPRGGAVGVGDATVGGCGPRDDGHAAYGLGATAIDCSVDGVDSHPGPTNGHWAAADWLGCRDGKWRPVEPGTFPLAHGLPARVGRLRGYGNAIVPQQAAEFVRAFLSAAA